MYSVIHRRAALRSSGDGGDSYAAARCSPTPSTPGLGVIDAIVPEPEGGAHTDWDEAARLLGEALESSLQELLPIPGTDLRRRRRDRFRALGVYASSTMSTDSTGLSTEAEPVRK